MIAKRVISGADPAYHRHLQVQLWQEGFWGRAYGMHLSRDARMRSAGRTFVLPATCNLLENLSLCNFRAGGNGRLCVSFKRVRGIVSGWLSLVVMFATPFPLLGYNQSNQNEPCGCVCASLPEIQRTSNEYYWKSLQ